MQAYRLLSAFPTLVLCIGCHQARAPLGLGEDWRNMSLRERQVFVGAYVDGSNSGAQRLCNNLEENVAILKIKNVVPSDRPCLHFSPTYTHGDTSAAATLRYSDPYVTVIDDFYKHSECRAMPYTIIMGHLNDAEYKSGEDLYRLIRSGYARWGSFSGFDGIEKCYSIDRKH